MNARHLAYFAALSTASAFGCDPNCNTELHHVQGTYAFQEDFSSSVGKPREVVNATLKANDGQVVIEYEQADGSRWKATYRIADRGRD